MKVARLISGLAPMAVVGVLVGMPSAEGVAAPAAASGDQTFTDTGGDSTVGRLDILSVRALSANDNLDFRVNLATKTIGATEHAGIHLDLNNDSERDIAFFFRGNAGGTLYHVRYPSPRIFELTPPSLGTFSNHDFGVTFNLRIGALGNPARLQFNVFTKESDEPQVWDWAPNQGWWSFAVREPSPQPTPTPGGGGGGGGGSTAPDFVARGSAMSPNPPRAGDSVAIGTKFVYRQSGRVVTGGRLSCRGTIGSRSISGTAIRDSGLHACVFDLPRSAGGQIFTGSVTLTVGPRDRTVRRSGRIVPASALAIRGPKTIPAAPVAGQQFSAAFRVELVQPGKPPRRITTGEVGCLATVRGKRLRVDFKGFFENSAVCAWDIPSSARGAILQATISVGSGGMTATKTFSRRVR